MEMHHKLRRASWRSTVGHKRDQVATITLAVEHDSTISWPYEKSLAANTPGDAADPNWHPSACNICGQLGHQAAQCTNGTINWRQLYGDESFRLKQPLYESDLLKLHKARAIDFSALEARAREYARVQTNAPVTNAAEAGQQLQGIALNDSAIKPEALSAAAVTVKPDLPPGWNIARDTAGRSYYWHVKTKKTTWEKPTADTPIE